MCIKTVRERLPRRLKPFMIGFVALALFILSCGDVPVLQEELFYPQIKQPSVTVKLLESKGGLSISSNGSYVVRCFQQQGKRTIYYSSAEMVVEMIQGKMVLSEKTLGELEGDLQKVSFVPKEGEFWMYLNGHPYRGVLEAVKNDDLGSVRVLNLIYVEDYLKGVVPSEIGKLSQNEIEALKAQTVAARTYSLSRLGQHADEGYDLEATVADQVYRGVTGEDLLGNQVIELTKREVLVHRGKLVEAYYHANSGGETEDPRRVWGEPRRVYLTSVEDTAFCSWSESYHWKESWTSEAIRRNIEAFLRSENLLPSGNMGKLMDLRVMRRAPSGRVELLKVVTDKGSYRITGDRIRWALRKGSDSNSILPSTRFNLQIQRDENGLIQQISASGRGNGHGVGMCQAGAIGMARKGYSYKEILAHYYPRTKIVQWN